MHHIFVFFCSWHITCAIKIFSAAHIQEHTPHDRCNSKMESCGRFSEIENFLQNLRWISEYLFFSFFGVLDATKMQISNSNLLSSLHVYCILDANCSVRNGLLAKLQSK